MSTDLINSITSAGSNKMQDWYIVKLLQAADLDYMPWEKKSKNFQELN